MRSLPPRLTARVWDSGSAARLSNRTEAACGLSTILPRRNFSVHPACPHGRGAPTPASAAPTWWQTFVLYYGLSHTVSTGQSTLFGSGRAPVTNEGSLASSSHTLRR